MKDSDSPTPPEGNGRDRRQHVRHDADALPDLSAYIGREQAVRLIDFSKRGALVETSSRLGPGRTVSIRFVTSDTELTLTGKVVRCWVSGLSGSQLSFQTALTFSEDNPLCERVLEEQAEAAADEAQGSAEPTVDGEAVLQLVASVQHSASELRTMFTSNEW